MRKYFVVFRACDAVQAFNRLPRPFGLEKRQLLQICFLSLYEALQKVPHEIHVIGDKLSDETQRFFRRFPVTLTLATLGNEESIRRAFALGLSRPDDEWVYFCEDDYLHQPQTFEYIDDFISNREDILRDGRWKWRWSSIQYEYLAARRLSVRPLFFFPPDYPDRYVGSFRRFSLMFLSRHCHWRQVTNTTFTFLGQARSLKRFRSTLERAPLGTNDALLSRELFGGLRFGRRGLCLSPVPGLSTHMHEGVMTPLVDWERLVEQYQHRLAAPALA